MLNHLRVGSRNITALLEGLGEKIDKDALADPAINVNCNQGGLDVLDHAFELIGDEPRDEENSGTQED